MPYIERLADGRIQVFANPQPFAQEFVAEDDPILLERSQLSVDVVREQVREQIRNHSSRLRDQITTKCSPQEAAAWIVKLLEVKAYQANSMPENAPVLAKEAEYRRISMAQMVQLVERKAAPFLEAEAKISGVRGFHEDQIDRLSTTEDLLAYDWLSGW